MLTRKQRVKAATMEYYRSSFLVLVFVSLLAKVSLATQHIVGGSQGWDESADFNSWASGQKFKVGDQLVFKYMSGLHSVVELASESAYKNCDLGSSVNSMSTGNDVVKVNKEGTRYFACGTSGHCDQGMKVKITTETGKAPSTPASASSSSTPASASMSSYSIQPFASFIFVSLATTLAYIMF